MQKKSTTKAKSTRTKKRAAATRKTRTPSTRTRRPKAKKAIAPSAPSASISPIAPMAPRSNAKLETEASPASTNRGRRPQKRSTFQRAAAKLGSIAAKVVRAIERK